MMLIAVAFAQTPTGTFQGMVKDPSGAGVPGAMVTIQNVATNEMKHLTTETSGRFVQPFLMPGVLGTGRQWTAAMIRARPAGIQRARRRSTRPTATGGPNGSYKSTDWGVTWTAPSNPGDVYGLDIDPYDSLHMIDGLPR